MSIHNKKINKSIDLNIIGTANLVKICNDYNKKLIFFLQVMSIQEKKVNMKQIQSCRGTIMVTEIRCGVCSSNVQKFSYNQGLYDGETIYP